MAAFRQAKPVKASRSSRDLLNRTVVSSIDSALKTLKACSRQLVTSLSSWQDETQVLERLYYKGKNQHRSALFWQRTVEMRRYGTRLNEMDLSRKFDCLRESFFDEAVVNDPKLMKASWTHFPSYMFLLHVLGQLSGAISLAEKTRERLAEIYRCYALSMQSGYFLQLLLTLAAICARLDALLSDLQPVLLSSGQTVFQMLEVLHPNDAMKGMRFIPQPPVAVPTIPPSSNATTLTSAPIPFDASEEDVGSFVFRSAKEQVDSFAHILEQHTATASKRSAAKMIANYRSAEAILLHEPTGPSLSPASRAAVLDSPSIAVEPKSVPVIGVAASTSSISSSIVKVTKKKRRDAEDSQRSSGGKPLKKKRVIKDDIDEIFGF